MNVILGKSFSLLLLATVLSGCFTVQHIPNPDPLPTLQDQDSDLIVVRASKPYAFTSGPNSISGEEKAALVEDLKGRFVRGGFCATEPKFLGSRSAFTVLFGGTDTSHTVAVYYECKRNPELQASYYVLDGDCGIYTAILTGKLSSCVREYTSKEDIEHWFGVLGLSG